jgi:hypothetical protein
VKTQAGIDKTGLFNHFWGPSKNTEKTTSFAAPLREKSPKKSVDFGKSLPDSVQQSTTNRRKIHRWSTDNRRQIVASPAKHTFLKSTKDPRQIDERSTKNRRKIDEKSTKSCPPYILNIIPLSSILSGFCGLPNGSEATNKTLNSPIPFLSRLQ